VGRLLLGPCSVVSLLLGLKGVVVVVVVRLSGLCIANACEWKILTEALCYGDDLKNFK